MAANYLSQPFALSDEQNMMNIQMDQTGSDGTKARVSLIGDLDDAGGKIARRQLARAVASGKVNLTIDLDRVDALNSGGLAALIATLRLARNRGGDVRVQSSQPHIRRIMELTGLSRVFRLTQPSEPMAAPAA
jgi:anti-sigma B factor antagonist